MSFVELLTVTEISDSYVIFAVLQYITSNAHYIYYVSMTLEFSNIKKIKNRNRNSRLGNVKPAYCI